MGSCASHVSTECSEFLSCTLDSSRSSSAYGGLRVRFGMTPAHSAILVLLLVALTLGVLVSPSRHALGQDFRPPATCEEVFRATTRGGASLTNASYPGGTGFGCGGAPARRGDRVLVERVVDGDTIELATGERVRYIGIDAPEVGADAEPFGDAARTMNRRLVEGRYVYLLPGVQDRDRFGRLLRYVFVDGILAEAELVREGLARAREYQPGQPYAGCTAALEDEARDTGRGMWVGQR